MKTKLNKILCIEDDADIRAIAQIALEDIGGFTVKFCSNGYEGLAEAEAFMPDLFLLDVMMPEIDGPTTLQKLRKLPTIKNVPTIFMTGKVQSFEMADYKKLGIVDVIAKPFDPMTLADRIRKYWSNYEQ